MEELFLQILNMSFTASYVILFVLLARLLLKKAPKIFSYALWSVVLFRLCCPFSFESAVSLLPYKTGITPASVLYTETPSVDVGISAVNTAINAALPVPNMGDSVNPMQILVAIGAALWVAVAVGMVLYSLLAAVRLKYRLKSAIHLEGNLYEVQYLPTAFVFGFPHAKIYLPIGLSDTEKSYILRHEQTHIKRLDYLIKPLAFLVLCVHWFNPFVWVAFFMCAKDMELSCDERVIKELGGGIKQDYSASLLALSTGRRIIGGCPLAFGENDTKSRIKNILNYKKPALWVAIVAVIAVVAVSVGLMANPTKSKKDDLHFIFGINATVLEIDYSNHTMMVTGADKNSKLGDRCFVTCDEAAIIKIVNESPVELPFEGLAIGDVITMDVGEIQGSNPSNAIATKIQLMTAPPISFDSAFDLVQQKYPAPFVIEADGDSTMLEDMVGYAFNISLPTVQGDSTEQALRLVKIVGVLKENGQLMEYGIDTGKWEISVESDNSTSEEKAFFVPDMDAEQKKFSEEYVEPIMLSNLLMRDWSIDNYAALLPTTNDPADYLILAFEDIMGQDKMQPLWNQYNGKFPEKIVEDVLLMRFPFTRDQLHEILASYYKPNEKIYAYEGGRGGGPIECGVTNVTKETNAFLTVEYVILTGYYADASTAEKDAYYNKATGTLTLKPIAGGGYLYRSVAVGEHTEITPS